MNINWSDEKNNWLMEYRNISFEMVLEKLLKNEILDDIAHPNQEKYAGQYMFIIEVDSYCYVVPYIETEEGIFLKTVYPDRRVTKKYLGVKNER